MSIRYHSVGPFEVLSRLGSGGMSDVLKAVDGRDQRVVALKIPKDDAGVREAERAGALLQKQLSEADKRVPAVYEIHEGNGDEMYIAMEYVEGEDLSERIRRGPIEPREAVRIAVELCELMCTAARFTGNGGGRAQQGIVHGDLKPRNIRLEPGGGVKVLDFGIAKALSLTRPLTRNEFGSLPYSSPERIESGNVDAHSDLWSVAVALYEMLTGQQPFRGESTRRLEQFIRSRALPEALPSCCPESLAAVLRKALAPRLERRYANAAALRDDLNAFLEGRPTAAAAEGGGGAGYEQTRRSSPTGNGVHGAVPVERTPGGSANGSEHAGDTRRTLGPVQNGAPRALETRRTMNGGAATPLESALSTSSPPIATLMSTAAAPAIAPAASAPAIAPVASAPAIAPVASAPVAPAMPTATPPATPTAAVPGAPANPTTPARWRFRLRWRWIVVLVTLLLLANEVQLTGATADLKSALPRLPRGQSESVWKLYQQLRSRSPLGIGTFGLAGDVRDWFVGAADELIADYRSDTPVIRESGWRDASAMLAHAASIAPRDRNIRARLLYCRGHLARINAQAAKGRSAAEAQRYLNEATSSFEEAARLRPHWLDPYLGLARTYVYGLEDPDQAQEALNRAEDEGYRSGTRDMALIGDGYRLRAEKAWSHAADFRDQPGEDKFLGTVKDDCEQALQHYEEIPAYGEVSRNTRKVRALLQTAKSRESELRRAQWRKYGLLAPFRGVSL